MHYHPSFKKYCMKKFIHLLAKPPQDLYKKLCYLGLAVLFAISGLHLLKGDLYYDTDVSRDMLLLEEMVNERQPSLIGGRTSVSGIFHGPLYYWMMLPFFAISGGNPVILSYVWFIMYWLFVVVFYWIGKKVFEERTALLSTTLLASSTISLAQGFTHSVLSNFLIVPVLYLAYQYTQTNKAKWLIATVLLAGMLIQFQMAFGVPVLVLVGGYTVVHILRQRNFSHLLAGFLLLLPISTFVVFDLRNNFLQLNSALAVATGKNPSNFSLNGYWPDRYASFIDTFRFWLLPLKELQSFAQVGALVLLLALMIRNLLAGKKQNIFVTLATLVIFGFWIVTGPFKGNVWPQYYRTLLPLVILGASVAMTKYASRNVTFLAFLIIVGSNIALSAHSVLKYWNAPPAAGYSNWLYYQLIATDILQNSGGKPFGYYVFTPDQFGYQVKYAMRYVSKANNAPAKSYSKQPITYLIEAPYWDDSKFLSKEYWRTGQVRINREPNFKWVYRNLENEENYSVLRYDLTAAEATISSEPTLLDGIFFR